MYRGAAIMTRANNHDFDCGDHRFQDTTRILFFSHDSSSLLGRILFGVTFLVSPFYRGIYNGLKQLSDLFKKIDQQLLPYKTC